MANRNLIAGTRAVYGNNFTDAAESMGAGIESSNSSISPATLAGLASMKNSDAAVKGYINSLSSEMDLVQLSDPEQNSIKGYLNSQKQLYAQLATELTQIDAMSPRYLELKNRMDSIKGSFVSLKNQTDKFKERKIQYLDDLENGRLSKGNKPEDYNAAASVYGGGALLIDPNGGINVVTDGGKNFTRYTDVKDPFLKDFKTADEILQQNNKLYSAGVPLNESKEALLRNQLKSKLSQDGSLESIVEDGLINNERLNVDLNSYETREDAINDVAEILLQGYRDSAAEGAEEKRIKNESTNPGSRRGGGGRRSSGGGSNGSDAEGTYLGYGRNSAADKSNFESNWGSTQSTASRSAEIMNTEAKDSKIGAIEYYRSFAPGAAIFGKNGKLVEGPRKEEIYVQKWYSSYDAKKYRGEAKTNQRWQLAPAIRWTKDGYKPVTIWRINGEGDWKVLTRKDYESELNGTAGVVQANTNTSGGGAYDNL